jgi:thiamine-monophosphate kinase
MREFDLIDRVKKMTRHTVNPVIRSIGDDCAILPFNNTFDMLMTADSLYEGVHFDTGYFKPWEIGARAIAMNISDICAMGGIPMYCLISMGFPGSTTQRYIDSLYSGINGYTQNYSVDIIGGDTISAPGLFLSVTLTGRVEKGRALRRDKASPGDVIFTTGFLGDSFAGLKVLQKKGRKGHEPYEAMPVKKHLLPVPGYLEGRLLLESGCVSACMDISDGLISDITRICEESGAGAVIEADDLPVSYSTAMIARGNRQDPVDYALYGGEDLELLFTVPQSKLGKFASFCSGNSLPVFRAGVMTRKKGVFIDRNGRKTKETYKKVWNHF